MEDVTMQVDAGLVRHSESIAALAAALAKAQGEMAGASKDKTNPHFKAKYADLASIWDACRSALSKNGLAVMQPASANGPSVTVTTLLAHSSGEWIESELTMTATQNTPQGIGSCLTYARRYALASMVGVAPEDDDGHAASERPPVPDRTQRAGQIVIATPHGYDDWLADLTATADNGMVELEKAWKASQPHLRKYLLDTNGAGWEAIKTKAARHADVKELATAKDY